MAMPMAAGGKGLTFQPGPSKQFLFGVPLPDGVTHAEICYEPLNCQRIVKWHTIDGAEHTLPINDGDTLEDVVNLVLVTMRLSTA